ncbi:hypothetical protein PCANC_00240 [Puccinia coronata f. sp. avenae]|uniref:Uncharacterized protein n=1 Tax=Puccinia coronata f. sp. avenae TaxID=200324 RepID=A0A2N5W940_9BASI|nr:hypothetical protein PCANC_00240 [Puccinia coronata f. sp. avenae]
MVNRVKFKLQLAVAVAEACKSDAEIDDYLNQLTNSIPSKVKNTLKSAITKEIGTSQLPGSIDRSDAGSKESPEFLGIPTNVVTESAVRDGLEGTSANHPSGNPGSRSEEDVIMDSEADVLERVGPQWAIERMYLERMSQLQRQEIIKLRHELAEERSGRTEPALASTVAQKRPQPILDVDGGDGQNKKQKKEAAKGKKTVRFDDQLKSTSEVDCDSAPQIIPSSQLAVGISCFDTLSRIIRLNQLLSSSSSTNNSPSIQIDSLTMQAIKEAAIGLLFTLQQSLQETSEHAFGKQNLTASTIPRVIGLINQSISSLLGPLFLPEPFSMSASRETTALKERWSETILPAIYQNVEILFGKIMAIIVLCCEHLEKSIWDESGMKVANFETERVFVLREELRRTADSLIRQSSGWTGAFQFHILQALLDKIETMYFSSHEHQVGRDMEALGCLVELLEVVYKNLSPSTVTESHLTEIRAMIGKMVCNQLYEIKRTRSSIFHRKLDRILMQLWVL